MKARKGSRAMNLLCPKLGATEVERLALHYSQFGSGWLPGTNRGDWVSARVGLEGFLRREYTLSQPGIDPRTVQLTEGRCNDYSISFRPLSDGNRNTTSQLFSLYPSHCTEYAIPLGNLSEKGF